MATKRAKRATKGGKAPHRRGRSAAVVALEAQVSALEAQMAELRAKTTREPRLISFAATWLGRQISSLESAHLANILHRALRDCGPLPRAEAHLRGIIAVAYEAGRRGLTAEGVGDSDPRMVPFDRGDVPDPDPTNADGWWP